MIALLTAIGCGEEDPPAPRESSDDDSSEQDEDSKDDAKDDDAKDDDSTGKSDDDKPRKPLDASAPKPPKPSSDAGSTSGESDSGTTPPAPVADAGTGSKPDASTRPTKDAGSSASAPGVCDKKTPHGCFTPVATGNHPMCPPQAPEQSASYPPQDEWKGCNGIMPTLPVTLDADARCSYEGPNKELASCICDTGLHWICSCSKSGQAGPFGFGSWPDCN